MRRGVRRSSASCCCRWLIVGRDPERVLELLLPTFAPVARVLGPMTRWIARTVATTRRGGPRRRRTKRRRKPTRRPRPTSTRRSRKGIIEGEERRLLQSIVDFGDTLVREVMTPRPDIVAIRDDGDRRRRARAVPRAGVLAVSGLQGQPRQHRRLRVREGSRRARAATTTRGRSRRCCGRRWSCRRPSGCPSC